MIKVKSNFFNRRGTSTCGPHNQYGTSIEIVDDTLWIGFSDGLYYLYKDNESQVKVNFYSEGLKSYIIDIKFHDQNLYISTLEDIYIRKNNSFYNLNFPDIYSHQKLLNFKGDTLLVASDSFLWIYYNDKWEKYFNIPFINSIYIDSNLIYIGSFNSLNIFLRENLVLINNYNTIPITSITKFQDTLLIGTTQGLFINSIPKLINTEYEIDSTFPFIHSFLNSPFNKPYNILPDFTYLFGGTFKGKYRVHRGMDYNNPSNTPVLAGADGSIISAGTGNHDANYITVNYGTLYNDWILRGVYVHFCKQPTHHSGDIVSTGDTIGFVGHTGRATNDHLHFETRLTINSIDYGKVNPSLWLIPIPGTGIISGRIVRNNIALNGVKIYGVFKPWLFDTPFIYGETYGDGVKGDPNLQENFVIDNVLPGIYNLKFQYNNNILDSITVRVRSGGISWIGEISI